jgi:hypothetical protein
MKEVDAEFSNTDYVSKISWLQNSSDDLYIPDYHDVLRVGFTKEFGRGKLSELVSLLSGRNFETRTFEEHIQEDSFEKLKNGIISFVNETHYKRFLMIIKSTGFINNDLISSQNALNFAYIIYLKLRALNMPNDKIEKFVKKWFVMSLLTNRYSSSPESIIDYDIKHISKHGIEKALQAVEDAHLSDSFWSAGLIQALDKASSYNPFLKIFFASQIFDNNKGFLSADITVRDLITHRGDIHHLFPRDYLKKFGYKQGDYNQIANFVYTQSEINIKIKNKSPKTYFEEIIKQCAGEDLGYGTIRNKNILLKNLEENCIPESIFQGEAENYQEFLESRRKLMAKKIQNYYYNM